LAQQAEHAMVRHEAAEALGALITSEPTIPLLKQYLSDKDDIVRESCEVATDMQDYYQGEDFEYADALVKKQ